MVSRGIPLLTSDRGGASEIARQPAFTFRAGSIESFHARLHDIMTRRVPLAKFWENEVRLFSMEDHLRELMTHYVPDAPALAVAAQ